MTKEVVELTTPVRVERLIDELSSLVSFLDRDKRLADRLYELLEKADEINAQLEAVPMIIQLLDSARILSEGQNRANSLSNALDQANRLFKETMDLSAGVELLKGQITERTPAVCPVCGQEWGGRNERFSKK